MWSGSVLLLHVVDSEFWSDSNVVESSFLELGSSSIFREWVSVSDY